MKKTEMGRNIYETLEELLEQTVLNVTEDDENYYVELKANSFHDNSIWVANKKTGKVSWMLLTLYFIDIESRTRPVDPDKLRESLN